jgi:hypothetical protein
MDARALVVDDDSASCEFVKEILVHATGMDVLALTDSRAAAAHRTKEKFSPMLPD